VLACPTQKQEKTFGGINTMFETLKNILVEELQLDPEEITLEAELANDLGINSIELADLVMLCEDKFNLEIEDDDIHEFITVNDVVEYLEKHSK
jgi:acyl carrier protein